MHYHLRRLCTLSALCSLLLTSCYSKEQRALNAQWEAQGAENAVRYIQGKYGFSAEVRSAEIDRIPPSLTVPVPDMLPSHPRHIMSRLIRSSGCTCFIRAGTSRISMIKAIRTSTHALQLYRRASVPKRNRPRDP